MARFVGPLVVGLLLGVIGGVAVERFYDRKADCFELASH